MSGIPQTGWDSIPEENNDLLPAGTYTFEVTKDMSSLDGDDKYVAYSLTVLDGPHTGRRCYLRCYVAHEKEFMVNRGMSTLKKIWTAIGVPVPPSDSSEAVNSVPFVGRIALRNGWHNLESAKPAVDVSNATPTPF